MEIRFVGMNQLRLVVTPLHVFDAVVQQRQSETESNVRGGYDGGSRKSYSPPGQNKDFFKIQNVTRDCRPVSRNNRGVGIDAQSQEACSHCGSLILRSQHSELYSLLCRRCGARFPQSRQRIVFRIVFDLSNRLIRLFRVAQGRKGWTKKGSSCSSAQCRILLRMTETDCKSSCCFFCYFVPGV